MSVLRPADVTGAPGPKEVRPEVRSLRETGGWNPENYAREQIRGLVRLVFFSHAARPVRQVVVSALESQTDVRSICRQVAESLARETAGSVAVVGGYPQLLPGAETHFEEVADPVVSEVCSPLRQIASRVGGNLWLVPDRRGGDPAMSRSLHSYLGQVRREFEFSIVLARPVGESDETTAMAQFGDGIILVLAAHRTRRATARKVKETLEAAQARILGVVLSNRIFPIPEAIYRRL